MRGRGLVIAAAVLQLAGAAMGLLGSLSMLVTASADLPRAPIHGLYVISAVDAAIAAIMIPASIALLLRKRWGWYVSIAMMGLFSAALLALPLTGALTSGAFGVGFGEAIVLLVIGAPILVTFGLLVGGRRAVFAATAKTAAGPTSATPLGE